MLKQIMCYGCETDEQILFQKYARRYQVQIGIEEAPVSMDNVDMAKGCSCISVSHKAKLTRPLLEELKKQGVLYISTRSIGVNHIDIEAAEDIGIQVENSNYSPDSVADYTLLLILMTLRNMKEILYKTAKQDFTLSSRRGMELKNLTVGVIGSGHIGEAVVRRLKGYGCKVITYDANKKSNTLESVLALSDLITLHIPLMEETYHFLNEERMQLLKKGAILINTARGGLIDTKALIKGVQNGQIGYAALDVVEGEEQYFYKDCRQQKLDNQDMQTLLSMDHVLLTPHTAFYTSNALEDSVINSLNNCLEYERRENVCQN